MISCLSKNEKNHEKNNKMYRAIEIEKSKYPIVMSVHNDLFTNEIKNKHISLSVTNKQKLDELHNIAEQILLENGIIEKINHEEKENFIEYHQYSTDGKNVSSAFDAHVDNVNGDCDTVIFYTHVDKEIEGGELTIFKQESISDDWLESIDQSEEMVEEHINPKSSTSETMKIVVLSGDVPHAIKPIYGFGHRSCIVVQILK